MKGSLSFMLVFYSTWPNIN